MSLTYEPVNCIETTKNGTFEDFQSCIRQETQRRNRFFEQQKELALEQRGHNQFHCIKQMLDTELNALSKNNYADVKPILEQQISNGDVPARYFLKEAEFGCNRHCQGLLENYIKVKNNELSHQTFTKNTQLITRAYYGHTIQKFYLLFRGKYCNL